MKHCNFPLCCDIIYILKSNRCYKFNVNVVKFLDLYFILLLLVVAAFAISCSGKTMNNDAENYRGKKKKRKRKQR